jgi:hypothetical protein
MLLKKTASARPSSTLMIQLLSFHRKSPLSLRYFSLLDSLAPVGIGFAANDVTENSLVRHHLD